MLSEGLRQSHDYSKSKEVRHALIKFLQNSHLSQMVFNDQDFYEMNAEMIDFEEDKEEDNKQPERLE